MEKLNLEDIQRVGDEVLLYIKRVCEDNHIRYFLASGTALGAKRHSGFIPWDDDIDIYMLRQDYEKFSSVIDNEKSPFKLLDVYRDDKYFLPFSKMVDTRTIMDWPIVRNDYTFGVWVDVFILDNVPDSDKECRSFHRKLDLLQRFYTAALYKIKPQTLRDKVYKLALCWTIPIGPRFFSKRLDKLSQKYNKQVTKRVGQNSFTAYTRDKEVFSKDFFEKEDLLDFCGVKHPTPFNTHEYLTHYYGDYMTLPPVEKRVSHHTISFYWLNSDNDDTNTKR